MIQALVRDTQAMRLIEPTPAALRAALADPGCTLWVDLEAPSAEEAALLSTVFNFHPLAIEDCLGHVEHPKLDDYGSYLYIVAHGLDCAACGYELETRELDLFLGPNYLVTHTHEPIHSIKVLRERVLRDERYIQRGPDGLAHAALDILVDDLMPVLERLDDDLEALEDEILAAPDQETLATILDIKRATLHLRRTLVPQREVVHRLSRDESDLVKAKTRLYFRDVYDHLVRVVDSNESLRDLVSGTMGIYLTAVSNRMNEVMKVLTLFTTVFMPLSLVAGVYGMNFVHMPGLQWRYGFAGVMVLLAAIAGGMVWWFRRRGWA